jgi:hypothetical protein
MNLEEMARRLPHAEMNVAFFNAHRTCGSTFEGEIERGVTQSFEFLLDPTRPASSYYNRAVARTPEAFAPEALLELPGRIVGIELTPAQLSPAVSAHLIERGFRPAYQLCYLAVAPTRTGERAMGRDVRRLDPSQVDFLFDLLQSEGVEFPPEKRARKRSYYCTDRFRCYVACDAAGVAGGWTTMHVEDNVAFFGNSFTLPQFRRSGVHGALLAARLNDAAALELAVAYTDVEHGSQSHYNCERAGFRTLTINTIWSRAEDP